MAHHVPVAIVSPVRAEHQDAKSFNSDLAAMAIRRTKLVAFLQGMSDNARKNLEVKYAYRVVDASRESFLPPEVQGADAIRVVRTWTNKAEFDSISRLYGLVKVSMTEITVSCIYYRVNGVLVKAGVGKDVLNLTNRYVSDDEWVAIKRGAVHERLLTAA